MRQKQKPWAVSRKIVLYGIEVNVWLLSEKQLLCKTLQSDYNIVYGFAEVTHLDLCVRDV